MKFARWIFTLELGTFRGAPGQPMMHAYVDGSSAPLCMPKADGEPPAGLSLTTYSCNVCRPRITLVFWGWVPFGKRFAWAISGGYPRHHLSAHGTADDEADALRQCLEALERLLPGDVPVEGYQGAKHEAEEYARELRADARAEKPSKGTGAQLREYAYRHEKSYRSWLSSDFEWKTETGLIIKKTRKRIFVEASTRTTEKGNTVLRTWSLDRAELESGKKSRYGWTLDPTPPFDTRTGKRPVPGWADTLGLSIPCTLAEAKRAFRTKAKEAHPDHGGSPEAFRRLKEAFDAASSQLGRAS